MKETDVKRDLKAANKHLMIESIENALSSGIPDTIALYDEACVFLEVKVARNSGDTPKIQLRSSQVIFFRKAHMARFNGAFLLVVHKAMLCLYNGVVRQDQISITKNGNGWFTVSLTQVPLFKMPYSTEAMRLLMTRLLPANEAVDAAEKV